MEVEAVLNRHPAVRESAVTGQEAAAGKTIVRGHVVLKKGRRPSEELEQRIVDWADRRLARYKAPREIVFVSKLPKTSNGKLIRRRLGRS